MKKAASVRFIKWLAVAAVAVACAAAFSVAASADAVTLTEEQTLALYGMEIEGEYWTGDPYYSNASSPGEYLPLTFHYAYPLSSIGYMETGGGFSGNSETGFSPAQINNDIRYLNGLVYIADSSQWGYGDFPTNNAVISQESYERIPLYNLELPMSINLTGLTDIVQYIGWSTSYFSLGRYYQYQESGYDLGWSALYAYNDNNRAISDFCDWKLYTNTAVDPFGKALPSPTVRNNAGQYVTGFKSMPFYRYYASDAPIDESSIAQFSFFRVSGGAASGSSFNISGINLGIQSLSPVYQHRNGANSTPPTGDIAIIIGCPKIYDYTPPVVTTAVTTRPNVPTTTRTTASPAVPQTMPTEVTDIPLIIINNNLDSLINQLNMIYNQLVINGEITSEMQQLFNPDLQPGEHVQIMDTHVSAQIQNALTYTLATIPQEVDENAAGFIAFIISKFRDISWLLMLGTFSLSLSLAAFILFRKGG